jgi:hypothetical protein
MIKKLWGRWAYPVGKTVATDGYAFGLDHIMPEARRLCRAVAEDRCALIEVTIHQRYEADDFAFTTITLKLAEKIQQKKEADLP